jgi:hypothetical protein
LAYTTLSILFLFYLNEVTSQMVRTSPSAIFPGLSAKGRRGSEAFLFAANQAALPDSAGLYIGILSERKFGLRELEAHQVAVLIPVHSAYVAVSGTYSGSLQYREGGLGLAYGLNLGSMVSAGVQFNHYVVRTKGYGGASTTTIEGGLKFRLTPQLQFGLHLYNPTRSKWSKGEGARLPQVYTLLLAYEVSEKVALQTALRKTEGAAAGVMCVLQYDFASRMIARAGIESATGSFFLGSGLQLRSWWLHLTISRHPQLGFTPGLMLTYHLQRR